MFQNPCLKYMETSLRKIMVSPKFNNWFASILIYIRATLTQTYVTKIIHKSFFIVSRFQVYFGAKFIWQNGKIGLFCGKTTYACYHGNQIFFSKKNTTFVILNESVINNQSMKKINFFLFLHLATF